MDAELLNAIADAVSRKKLYHGILEGKSFDDPTLAKHTHVWREAFGIERYQRRFMTSVPSMINIPQPDPIPEMIDMFNNFGGGSKGNSKGKEVLGFDKVPTPTVGPFRAIATILKQLRSPFSGPRSPSTSRGPTVAPTPGFASPQIEDQDMFLLGTERGEKLLCSEHEWRKLFRGIADEMDFDLAEEFVKTAASCAVKRIRDNIKKA